MDREDDVPTIDEVITVVPYDPIWLRSFADEEARVRDALGTDVIAVEHFGSTSVPGLAAKPVVDLLVGLQALPPSPADRAALQGLGYEHLGEAGVLGRHAFRTRYPRAFNLAVVQWDGLLWRDNLLIRDYLRTHSIAALRYVAEKDAAMAAGLSTLLAYSDHKAMFIQDLLGLARVWAGSGRQSGEG